ncbi:hypothetical protein B0H66DRAFT_566279 [Apodospora peruviana]|uniref:Uncharacterized protein n=1 Tax=Apodospora peruviana TaxID=516989 RepID=A0AAE0HVE5_9PEZI|nr:hypothetical protein B0H66DRAFT_566279 [Apodospora peruviana]
MDHSSESTQPWTATRCHRLLRPLLTHIAALRKEKARRAAVSCGDATISEANNNKTSVASGNKKRRNPPDPASSHPQKKIRYKYSTKASHTAASYNNITTPQKPSQRRRVINSKPSSSRQAVALPTPFLRRVKNQPLSSSPNRGLVDDNLAWPTAVVEQSYPDVGDSGNNSQPRNNKWRCSHPSQYTSVRCSFETEFDCLRGSTDPERYALYESVFRALDSLLRATSPTTKQPAAEVPAAPKSLLAMCLRKVPDYVAELEFWEQKDAEDHGTKSMQDHSTRVSFEVYSELEGLGVGASGGWKHLCTVVRAHGVHIIREAVSEGQILDDAFTKILIRLCMEYMPHTEFAALIDSFVDRQYPKPSCAEDGLFCTPALQPLRVIMNFCWNRKSFALGKLADLFAGGLLPAEWIVQEDFNKFWVWMAGEVVKKSLCQDAVEFIISTVSGLCRLVSGAGGRHKGGTTEYEHPPGLVQKKLSGALAALTSIVLLVQQGASSARRIVSVSKRVTFIAESCSAEMTNKLRTKTATQQRGIYLLSLCAYLSSKSDSALSKIQAAWRKLQGSKGSDGWTRQYDATTVFISTIAYVCGRGAASSPGVYLARLCDELEKLELPGDPFSNIRVDGAFSLAEQTGDLRDLAFAESLKAGSFRTNSISNLDKNGKVRGTRGGGGDKDKTSFVGFRWDEGISEWVNVSPVLAPMRRRSMRIPLTLAYVDNHLMTTVPVVRIIGTSRGSVTEEGEGEDENDSTPTSKTSDDEAYVSDNPGEPIVSPISKGPYYQKDVVDEDEGEGEEGIEGQEEDTADEQEPDEQPSSPQPETEPSAVLLETPLPENLLGSHRLRRPVKPLLVSSSPFRPDDYDDDGDDDELSSGSGNKRRPTAKPSTSTMPTKKGRKRRARTSLLSLQPVRKVNVVAGAAGTEGNYDRVTRVFGDVIDDLSSDVDELSFC